MSELPLPHLDPISDRAVFRQIADHIRHAIETGALSAGDKVPSEAKLMQHYGVARMTIRHALQILQGEGLTVAEHGRGVFVRTRPLVRRLASDRFARRHRDLGKAAFIVETEGAGGTPTVDSIAITEANPSPDVAARLALDLRELVVARTRRYLINGQPVEMATSYIPHALAVGTRVMQPDSGPGGIYARLEEKGHRLERFEEEVRARMPYRDEVRALELAPGVPVFHLIRTAYAVGGRAIEVCDTVMSTDAYVLTYELPAS
ncbi:GntR family transcriptional regulator [Nonomuraea longicatena]|uniref:GntR family transcriptional regulator n=1 Tax=Nonomuraea longicatena TaxID=83682 RepID=A0ABP4ADV0_9ACTN